MSWQSKQANKPVNYHFHPIGITPIFYFEGVTLVFPTYIYVWKDQKGSQNSGIIRREKNAYTSLGHPRSSALVHIYIFFKVLPLL